jgi:group I intron endonuclease
MIGIYKITSPSKKIYIGQSVDIEKRFNVYRLLLCKNQLKIYRSLKKYGVENHKFEIIHICDVEELNELEKYYVDLYQTFNNKHGLNLKDGGGSKGRHSIETCRKISESKKNRSALYTQKISDANRKRIYSKETKQKISISSSKIVLDTQTGVFYVSALEVSKLYKIKESTLRNKLNGYSKNNTNFIYA